MGGNPFFLQETTVRGPRGVSEREVALDESARHFKKVGGGREEIKHFFLLFLFFKDSLGRVWERHFKRFRSHDSAEFAERRA